MNSNKNILYANKYDFQECVKLHNFQTGTQCLLYVLGLWHDNLVLKEITA